MVAHHLGASSVTRLSVPSALCSFWGLDHIGSGGYSRVRLIYGLENVNTNQKLAPSLLTVSCQFPTTVLLKLYQTGFFTHMINILYVAFGALQIKIYLFVYLFSWETVTISILGLFGEVERPNK